MGAEEGSGRSVVCRIFLHQVWEQVHVVAEGGCWLRVKILLNTENFSTRCKGRLRWLWKVAGGFV